MSIKPPARIPCVLFTALLFTAPTSPARADAVTAWNARANAIIVDARLGTPPAVRLMAIVQTAVHDAVREVDQRATSGNAAAPARSAALDAAVAAANRAVLTRAMPSQQASIQSVYQAALAGIADGPGRDAGVAAGERAAAAVFAARADDGAAAPESYRPHTTAGVYVPTLVPAVTQWPTRRPWILDKASQFRPGPPPSLKSTLWARDFNEIRMLGAKDSAHRTAEQTEIARFWEFSLPAIYHGVMHAVAAMDGRDAVRNARLFAVVSQAMDDAMISVFDAKYHYQFWRPVTAIRNADIDGNDATVRDASWMPLIDTPLHPEYPCAHCILAATVGTLVKADVGSGPAPVLSTASPSARGATRRWADADALMREVADARIYDGVHYRTSTEVGLAMGRRIGELAAARLRETAD